VGDGGLSEHVGGERGVTVGRGDLRGHITREAGDKWRRDVYLSTSQVRLESSGWLCLCGVWRNSSGFCCAAGQWMCSAACNTPPHEQHANNMNNTPTT